MLQLSKKTKSKRGLNLFIFRSGESSAIFKLCRSNNTSIKRHVERRHKNNVKEADVRSYYDCDETVRMARKKCEAEQGTETSAKPNITMDSSLCKKPVEITLKTHTPEKMQKEIDFKTSNIKKRSSSAVKESEVTRDSALHSKIDNLIDEFKDFKIRSNESRKESQHNPLSAVDGKVYEETAQLLLKWPDTKNILDLVSVCKHIKFFSGDEENGILSVVRCETCYNYIKNYKLKRPSLKLSAMDAAKKGIGG